MELIDRHELLMLIAKCRNAERISSGEAELMTDFLLSMQTISSRPKGKWITTENGYVCTNCTEDTWEDGNYCPHCGAEMEK